MTFADVASVRARILAIALVSGLVLIVLGVATAFALVRAAEHAEDFADTLESKPAPGRRDCRFQRADVTALPYWPRRPRTRGG